MHEYSITRALLDQALAETEKLGYKRINRIHLLLGEGGGVVPDCIQFYFDEMKKGTAAAAAALEFKRVPLRIRCPKCGAEFGKVEEMCSCNAGGDIISGQELAIESLDVD
ncbi:MAG TPA: hydrogenase maturation nickel metallochaperone HypA [bacterium]|nr:hydrogenase maturation nickel metallochaperone HypA [bacterium]